jgi:hypothetical protein
VVNVAGPNEVPVPSEHPNNDLLADLAADVLSADLAGHVQEHVIGCSICAQVLADAESVRAMLLQIEPEQMPDAVLARLERALVAVRREDESGARGGFAEDAAETRAAISAVAVISAEPSEQHQQHDDNDYQGHGVLLVSPQSNA